MNFAGLKVHIKNAQRDIKAGEFEALANKISLRAQSFYEWVQLKAMNYWHAHPFRCKLALGAFALFLTGVIASALLIKKNAKPQTAKPAEAATLDDAITLYIDKNKPY